MDPSQQFYSVYREHKRCGVSSWGGDLPVRLVWMRFAWLRPGYRVASLSRVSSPRYFEHFSSYWFAFSVLHENMSDCTQFRTLLTLVQWRSSLRFQNLFPLSNMAELYEASRCLVLGQAMSRATYPTLFALTFASSNMTHCHACWKSRFLVASRKFHSFYLYEWKVANYKAKTNR
jgi:hypothetical protein